MVANLKDPSRHRYTLEEYFALERAGETRYEYWDGEILSMSGGSRQHARICSNLHYRLRVQLEGTGCTAFTGDLAVKTALLPPYRYPDAMVACRDLLFEKTEGMDILLNPIVVIEVLSPGTASRDRNQKREAYQAISSVQEVLLLSQEAPLVTRYRREQEEWVREDIGGLALHVELPAIGCRLAMPEIYEGVLFA